MPWLASLPASAQLSVMRCDAGASEELLALSLHLSTTGALRSVLQVSVELRCAYDLPPTAP